MFLFSRFSSSPPSFRLPPPFLSHLIYPLPCLSYFVLYSSPPTRYLSSFNYISFPSISVPLVFSFCFLLLSFHLTSVILSPFICSLFLFFLLHLLPYSPLSPPYPSLLPVCSSPYFLFYCVSSSLHCFPCSTSPHLSSLPPLSSYFPFTFPGFHSLPIVFPFLSFSFFLYFLLYFASFSSFLFLPATIFFSSVLFSFSLSFLLFSLLLCSVLSSSPLVSLVVCSLYISFLSSALFSSSTFISLLLSFSCLFLFFPFSTPLPLYSYLLLLLSPSV